MYLNKITFIKSFLFYFKIDLLLLIIFFKFVKNLLANLSKLLIIDT